MKSKGKREKGKYAWWNGVSCAAGNVGKLSDEMPCKVRIGMYLKADNATMNNDFYFVYPEHNYCRYVKPEALSDYKESTDG